MPYGETANPVQPCGGAILALLFAVADWCLSLLFRAGSGQRNVLDGKGFQRGQRAHPPCLCGNLPANGELGESPGQNFGRQHLVQRGPAGSEPGNGIGFARDGVDWFLFNTLAPSISAHFRNGEKILISRGRGVLSWRNISTQAARVWSVQPPSDLARSARTNLAACRSGRRS